MTGSDDQDGAALGRLLTDLADDPDAPPNSVSALSVIAAAKSEGRPAVRSGSEVAPPAQPASVGELHVLTAQQDAERKAKRRRTTIIAGLAAACAIGVAAIVVPLALSNSSGTTTSGASAQTSAARAQAEPGGAAAAGGSAAAPTAESEAAGQQQAQPGATAQDQSGGTPPQVTVDGSNPDANRPPPGADALTQTVPVPGGTAPTDGAAAGGGVTASCWPALSDTASAALVAALPPGSFEAPGLLGLGCPADPVAGASLTGTVPDTQLVVRVTRAASGACAQSSSETGAKCVARGGDQYVSNDSGNLSVYAYGDGYEVEVGGRPATGIAPIPSGLTADQLAAAAAAVLGALG